MRSRDTSYHIGQTVRRHQCTRGGYVIYHDIIHASRPDRGGARTSGPPDGGPGSYLTLTCPYRVVSPPLRRNHVLYVITYSLHTPPHRSVPRDPLNDKNLPTLPTLHCPGPMAVQNKTSRHLAPLVALPRLSRYGYGYGYGYGNGRTIHL